jgi:large subunit ribosomal protein L6
MSRIGKQPVKVPGGVTIKLNGTVLEVGGPKGQLKRDTFGRIKLEMEGGNVVVSPVDVLEGGKYWGLYRTLLSNMVEGVTAGFTRQLELVGTGYRAQMQGKALQLTVGKSHPVIMQPPAGVTFDVDKAGKVVITGPDKESVGQMAATVRSARPPEPYHGKGVRYAGEVIATKVGKSAGKK